MTAGMPAQNGGLISRLIHAGAWSVVAHLTTAASAFAVSIVVARQLGTAEFGNYSYYLWLARLLAILLAFGIPNTLSKFVAERLGAGDDGGAEAVLGLAARFHLLLLPAAGGVAAVATWFLSHDGTLTAIVGAGAAVFLLGSDFDALLPALRRFRELSTLSMGTSVLLVVSTVVCAWLGVSFRVYLLLQVLTTLVGVLCGTWLARAALRRARGAVLDPAGRTAFVRYARIMTAGELVNAVLWGRPEVLFLQRYSGDVAVGLYSAALRLSSLAAILPLVAAQAVMPEFARLRGAGDEEGLRAAYPDVCRVLAVVAAPLAILGAAVAHQGVIVVYGAPFAGAATATALLMIASFVNAVSGPATAAIVTGFRPRFLAEIGAVTAVLNVVLAILVIPHHGVLGAAAVNAGIQVYCVIFGAIYVQRRMGLRYPLVATLRMLALAGIAAVPTWLLARTLGGLSGLVVAGAVGLLLYPVLLVVTGTLDAQDLARLRRRDAHT